MAVEIPKLNRFEPQAPAATGRIEANAPNLLGSTAPIRQGANQLVESTINVEEARQKAIRKQELAAKELKAEEFGIKYEQKLKADLDVLGQLKGDVTPAYKSFDEKSIEFENEIYKQAGEDPETRAMLRERIIRANGRIADTRNTNQTKQYYAWQKEVTDGSVKLKQDNAMKSSEFLDVTTGAGIRGVKTSLDDIQASRTNVAIQNGYDIKQVKDEKTGRVTWDYSGAPAIEAQIKKDIGDAVIPMVKALNASGKTNEAKWLINDQKAWLNAEDLSRLMSDNDDADVRNQALALTATLKNQSGKAAFDEIDKSNKSEAIKFKARELVDTRDRQNENANARKRKDANNYLYEYIDEKQRSTQPFATISEFKDSPQYKELKGVLTPSDLKTLEQRIEAPPSSDPKALQKISEVYTSTGFKNLSNAEFNKLLGGLDQQARNRYTSLRESLVKPPKGLTEDQARSRLNTMTGYFMSDAKIAGIIPKNNKDKWSEKDVEYYTNKVEPAWIEYYNKHVDTVTTDPTSQKALVREFVRDFTANPENTPPRKGFFGLGGRDLKKLPELSVRAQVPNSPLVNNNTTTLGVKPGTVAPTKNVKPATSATDIINMSKQQYDFWVDEYMKETGASSEPENPSEFQAWINKRMKK